MSEDQTTSTNDPGRKVVWGAIAVGAVVVLALLVFGAQFVPLPVSIDGRTRTAPFGVTVEKLQAEGLIIVRNGDLVAAKDKRVLREAGGTPAVIRIDGRSVRGHARVWPWSVVATHDGTAVVESVVTTRVAEPIKAKFVGTGPSVYMSQPGSVGLKEVRKGDVSGDVVASRTLINATPAIFVRTRPGGARMVALTFDDGPWKGSTDAILKVLRQYRVKATFFMVGRQVAKRAATVRQVARDGHTIGTHSWSHPDLTKLSQKKVASEIRGAQVAIRKATGRMPVWFRPPFGAVNRTVYAEAGASKSRLILWDVDTLDWRRPPPAKIADRVVRKAKPGSVILMHDGGGNRANTVAALPMIITKLRAQGYQIVTLDQLFAPKAKARPAAKPAAKAPAKSAAAPAKAPAAKN